jgi:poly(glycerol-phosphate) alpha-glucosyltransferase
MVLDVAQNISGLEYSAFAREKLFREHLDLKPIIVTNYYNPNLHKNKRIQQAQNRISPSVLLLNMYDFFQQALNFDELKGGFNSELLSPFRRLPVPDTNDLRLYNDKGEFIAYCKRHEDSSVNFINYLHNGIVFRRETYDSRGFLSKIDQIFKQEDHELVHESFLRPDGTLAISKDCKVVAGLSTVQMIHLINEQGRITNIFNNEKEFIDFWLENLVSKNTDATFIIDRCVEFYEPLQKIKNKLTTPEKPKLIPVIHSVHTGGDVLAGEVSKFYKSVVENISEPDATIVFTKAQKEDILQRFGEGNIQVIPHSYHRVEQTASFEQRNPLKVVYLARYAPEKNHDLAVEAFKLVVESVPKAQLHLYGFGEKKNDIIEKVKTLGLEKNVFVNDFVHNIGSIYQEAGLSILTSGIEGFCMSVMESLFYACPVVAFDIKYGPADMIQHGVNGFLVKNKDTAQFAKQIIDILKSPKLHKQLIAATPNTLNAFKHETVAEQWEKVL